MERTKEDFIELMKGQTDDELLSIIEKGASFYSPEALAAVMEILTGRGVSYNAPDSLAFQPFAEKYYASTNRFADYVIDMIINWLLVFAVTFVLVLAGAEPTDALSYTVAYVVLFLYYLVLEYTCGKTVGKMILGLKVVDKYGNRPSAGRIALRTLCRFVPFDNFSFLFGDGWDKDGNFSGNWHDQWSKTYVVDMRQVEADNEE